jgi:GcrA cell cycle regulator
MILAPPSPVAISKSPWPRRDAELRALWAEGHSSRVIGKHMGLSRSAVIGRAHRIGLEPRRAGPPEVVPIQIRAPVRYFGAPVQLVLPPLRFCAFPMWPHGVRAPKPPVFCGEPVWRRSYCYEHAQLALVPVRAVAT